MMKTLNKLSYCINLLSLRKNIQAELNLNFNITEKYKEYIYDFKQAVMLLNRTIEENDQIAIQCALTRVRITSLNLSNLYADIIDDVVSINSQDLWPEIPEDYKIPDHYNYPQNK
ncbi:hypothetical protein V2H77_22540 [Photorhabdus sp. P32]|uniref:Uncharacterized protein n=1 Tax=Photorhabdus aegyptia TaxID=2805098 RepID=A0A022PBV0_9GAMM|nr:hypothetical protein [Photorhabdus aegyptia]EYU13201.1 hypothetical protein BA1DRAFT_04314 [Photorhabdus aegyptia]